jgi:hypothetical protein
VKIFSKILKSTRALILSALVFFYTGHIQADQISYSDAHIKAAYILKLISFVDWPPNSTVHDICVVDSDLIGSALALAQESSSNFHDLSISRKDPTSNLKNCQVVFIGESATDQIGHIIFSVSKFPILTISDSEEFIDRGGMIGFVKNDNRIAIEINKRTALENNLMVSSKLLQIARRVVP